MITTLGPISLGDNMHLRGLPAPRVAVDMQRSDAGVAQILVAPIEEGGELLDLEGHITLETEAEVMALSAAGVPVELVHPLGTLSVLVLGVTMENWIDYVDPLPSDWRVGTINLMRV